MPGGELCRASDKKRLQGSLRRGASRSSDTGSPMTGAGKPLDGTRQVERGEPQGETIPRMVNKGEKVVILGIGCIIIFANEPAKLSNWYSTVLGVKTTYYEQDQIFYGVLENPTSGSRVEFGIRQAAGPMMQEHHSIMVNYRVDNLDGILEQVRSQNVQPQAVVDQPHGRFAQLTDPEGNAIQLWQAPSPASGRG